jgi:hypothetical protein
MDARADDLPVTHSSVTSKAAQRTFGTTRGSKVSTGAPSSEKRSEFVPFPSSFFPYFLLLTTMPLPSPLL